MSKKTTDKRPSTAEGMKIMENVLSQQQVTMFLGQVSNRIGCFYCWPTKENGYSGKDLDGAKYPLTYDCSGLVTASLYASVGLDRRSTWNANRLMKNCSRVSEPKPGDLAFYGPTRALATHVMVVMQDGSVCGASGGGSNTTSPQIAKKQGAMVRRYKSHLYRDDFIGFGRLTSKDK